MTRTGALATARDSGRSSKGPGSYYGQPILAKPVWKPTIAIYFFAGGLAGAASVLGFAARLAGNDKLARAAWTVAAGFLPARRCSSPTSADRFAAIPRGLGRAAEALAAVFGPALATYTAVLVADTAVPAWHGARRELPFVFVGSARPPAPPARRCSARSAPGAVLPR